MGIAIMGVIIGRWWDVYPVLLFSWSNRHNTWLYIVCTTISSQISIYPLLLKSEKTRNTQLKNESSIKFHRHLISNCRTELLNLKMHIDFESPDNHHVGLVGLSFHIKKGNFRLKFNLTPNNPQQTTSNTINLAKNKCFSIIRSACCTDIGVILRILQLIIETFFTESHWS